MSKIGVLIGNSCPEKLIARQMAQNSKAGGKQGNETKSG